MAPLQRNRNEEWSEISPLSDSRRGGSSGNENLLLQKTKGHVRSPTAPKRGSLPTTTSSSKSHDLSQTLRRHSSISSSGRSEQLIPTMNHIPRNDSSRSALTYNSSSRLSHNGTVSSSSKKTQQANINNNKLRRSMESSPAKLSCHASNKRCSDSYQMFQRCSTGSSDLSTISCSAVVASYMKCAFDQC